MKLTPHGRRMLERIVDEARDRHPNLGHAEEQVVNRPLSDVTAECLLRVLAAHVELTTLSGRSG